MDGKVQLTTPETAVIAVSASSSQHARAERCYRVEHDEDGVSKLLFLNLRADRFGSLGQVLNRRLDALGNIGFVQPDVA